MNVRIDGAVRRRRRLRVSVAVAATAVGAVLRIGPLGGDARAQEPLPALEPFLAAVKVTLQSDDRKLDEFTYVQTVTEREWDGDGRITKTKVRVYEVFPGEEIGYRRLVEENGSPVPPEKLAREDEKQRRRVEEFVRKRQAESPRDKRRRLKKAEAERREEAREVDELFRLLEGRIVGRERIDGRPMIVLDFEPRGGVRPATRYGKVFARLKGRAWFHERDHELVKAELEVIDTVSFGWGLLARLHRGTRASLERRSVDGSWLPARLALKGAARVLVFKGVRLDTEVEVSAYRRTSGVTSETFLLPKPPP